MSHAVRSAQRPAVRSAFAAAALIFACCVARSDAHVPFEPHERVSQTSSRAMLHAATSENAGDSTISSAQANAIVASTQGVYQDVDGSLNEGAHVARLHIDTQVHARRVSIAAEPRVQLSSYLQPGRERVMRAGERGIAWVTERLTWWNDVLVGRRTLERQVIRQPKPALILVGMPRTLEQLRNISHYHIVSTAMSMVATAYTAESATPYPTGYTATGMQARRGVVAVDPHVIPLGSLLFVAGYGIAVAADTGGAIVGDRIDLCMDSYGDAMDFGRRVVQVYILKR